MLKETFIILAISVCGPIIGSVIGVVKKPSERWINNMLAFAAGMMIAISLLELVPAAIEFSSILISMSGLLLGGIFMYALDISIPHVHPEGGQEQGSKLKRTAIYLVLGIFLHNFPEGMALAIGKVADFQTALIIALGISIHNIPEGICTSAPYYYATKKRLKSFLISSSTIIPIIIGFFLASYLFGFISNTIIGLILSATAGLMIYISADELIPNACAKKNRLWEHPTIFSLLFGILLVLGLRLLG